jgi:tryptophan synthase
LNWVSDASYISDNVGLPFTDPLADGPTIQESNDISLANGTNIPKALDLLRQARASGLTVPVILMGYYNPLLIYGEERVVTAAKEAGANGFIVVDLPPEEAVSFRNCCSKAGFDLSSATLIWLIYCRLSYVPLVAPATSMNRLQSLASIADSFIYVVSRMGVTGSSSSGKLSDSLPELCARTRKFAGNTPIAVGFGVNHREHFLSIGDLADGVVIGSKIVAIIKDAPLGKATDAIRDYCREVSRPRTSDERNGGSRDIGLGESINMARVDAISTPTATISRSKNQTDDPRDDVDLLNNLTLNGKSDLLSQKLPARFGEFGGQYVPESLFDCLVELEQAFITAINDPLFWEEFRSYYPYMNRPSNLQLADRLTDHCGGAKIWLKREDLNHTGFLPLAECAYFPGATKSIMPSGKFSLPNDLGKLLPL